MDKIISVYVLGLKDDNPAVTRGFSLALGCLPAYTIPNIDRQKVVFNAIINATFIQKNRDERDAETRRNAMKALADLACRVGVGENGLNAEMIDLIFTSLFNGTMDYCIEDRGDVGSWIRKESLLGMEKFLNTLIKSENKHKQLVELKDNMDKIKIETIIYTKYGKGRFIERDDDKIVIEFENDTIGSRMFPLKRGKVLISSCQIEIEEGIFKCGDAFERNEFLTKNITDAVTFSLKNQKSMIKEEFVPQNHYYTQNMVVELISVLIKQSVEKIDNIRQVAGDILLRILYSDPPYLYIPHKGELQKIIPKDFNSWSSPQFVFPMMVNVLTLDTYRDSFVEGIVVSAGGLTESLSKPSSDAIIKWCKNQGTFGLMHLAHFAFRIVRVFELYKGNVRIIYPLFKLCENLLSNDCFSKINEIDLNRFYTQLLQVCIDEVKKTRDVKKILYSIPIFIDLIDVEGEISKNSIKHLFVNLTHAFPKVRVVTAEQLYIKFLSLDNLLPEEDMDKVLDILSSTDWNSDV